MHFEVNGVERVINSTIGGKQGDLLFPGLFNLHIAAIMMIWRKRRTGANCSFRTKQDFVMGSGARGDNRKWNEGGKTWKLKPDTELFVNNDGCYADDTGLAYCTREDIERDAPILIKTFADCGMDIHIKGPTDKKAKTVVLFCAMGKSEYDRLWSDEGGADNYGGTDLSDIPVGTVRGVPGCVIPVVDEAKYLGSLLQTDIGHEGDVDARIGQASSAFGSLRLVFKSKHISLAAKRAA